MEAGRELDALIAERVMGEPLPNTFSEEWELTFANYLNGTPTKSEHGNWYVVHDYATGDKQEWQPSPFSTNIANAWKVVERLREHGKHVKISLLPKGDWNSECEVTVLNGWADAGTTTSGNSAPLAVCLAALKSIGRHFD